MPTKPTGAGLFVLSVPQTQGAAYTAATANARAHTNPENLDLIQIMSQGGAIVWNLDYLGNSHFNPANPTKKHGTPVALFLQLNGSSVATAFSNPAQLDIYQIHDGSKVVHHVDYLGNSFTP